MNTEKQVFKTRIDNTFYLMHFAILAVMLSLAIYFSYINKNPSMSNVFFGWLSVAVLFTITSFLLLKIIINGDYLMINVGFNIYKIDIKTINTIQTGKTMWFGIHKHGTATKGLIISSKFKNDFYITPQEEALFLHKLLEINPTIIIKKD